MKELVLGVGHNLKKILALDGNYEYTDPTTIDINPRVNPHILHDLAITPWPVESDTFDEVHAYEVLEHFGQQGDWKAFFDTFSEIHRVLKMGGVLCFSVPLHTSIWAWGDPGHTRLITKDTLIFLDQEVYKNAGNTPMTDYRFYWKGHFKTVFLKEDEHRLFAAIQKQEF